MSTILITGAAGFIGSHTTEEFLSRGCRVIGVDNLRTGSLHNLHAAFRDPNFIFRKADAAEPGTLSAMAAEFRPGTVVHLAGLAGIQECVAEPDLNLRV